MLGFESTDFSPDNLATMRTTIKELMAAAQAELPDVPGVTSSDAAAPGPDGNDVPARTTGRWTTTRPPHCPRSTGSTVAGWCWATST